MVETQTAVFPPIRKTQVTILQFNIGRLCNQACQHCHVDSSPKKSGAEDNAPPALIDEVLDFLRSNPKVGTIDITGGAPELNEGFRRLVEGARALGRKVLVRHNITVQFEPGMADLPEFFKQNQVELFCSLPCYSAENVDKQRGRGVFELSIQGLKNLNAVGFGMKGSGLDLHLVYNPIGANLPPAQEELEPTYHAELDQQFGIQFNNLLTITNQPIHRFRDWLLRSKNYETYMDLLRENYNPSTLAAVMCRNALSLRWDGRLFDCDFNLVKDLAMVGPEGQELSLSDLDLMDNLAIQVDDHCFACTAGAGSSCGGALVV
ncbi:MAG: radical SAM protein [Planctomycetota bacterium]|nr:MAG: radical SAM protein [Planctomycetota bacterium]